MVAGYVDTLIREIRGLKPRFRLCASYSKPGHGSHRHTVAKRAIRVHKTDTGIHSLQ